MTVPLLDLRRGGAELDAELISAFEGVLKSGHYILGPEVEALERECAEYSQCRFGIGVSSGTDALLAALMAIDLQPGDEVICPTYTFFATAGSIWRTGARPVFVDSVPDSLNLDPKDVEKKITPRTKAIVAVHLFGQCADMEPVLAIARRHGLKVIEDAAQAIGAEYQGRRAGSLGDVGCFSFFPSKNLGGFGDGGMITTNDEALNERLRVLRAHGSKPKYYHSLVGGNFRLDAVQAALIRVKLRRLDGYTQARQKNAARYDELFLASSQANKWSAGAASTRLFTLPSALQTRHVFNQYIVTVAGGQRDALRKHLQAEGIGTEVYYPVPMHLQACFSSLGHKVGDFPVAEAAAQDTVAIPIFPELTGEEVESVVRSMLAFAASR
ncbi:MAG: DegT/DnrJ/EryC1/StrS family aminotransferase [Polyangiaceae bacterium]|nr:DegT/DnrJ/EryC1/StrS family aminotransferase [Polyangiaceae bacterium]